MKVEKEAKGKIDSGAVLVHTVLIVVFVHDILVDIRKYIYYRYCYSDSGAVLVHTVLIVVFVHDILVDTYRRRSRF